MNARERQIRQRQAEETLAAAEARGWVIRPGSTRGVLVAELNDGDTVDRIFGSDAVSLAANVARRLPNVDNQPNESGGTNAEGNRRHRSRKQERPDAHPRAETSNAGQTMSDIDPVVLLAKAKQRSAVAVAKARAVNRQPNKPVSEEAELAMLLRDTAAIRSITSIFKRRRHLRHALGAVSRVTLPSGQAYEMQHENGKLTKLKGHTWK